jgi:group I intron endonuclease
LEANLKRNRSHIYRSILKHGYSKFSFLCFCLVYIIDSQLVPKQRQKGGAPRRLEYCAPDKVIEREQYYIDRIKPKYNILKFAGSCLGRNHSEETIVKLRNLTPEKSSTFRGLKRLHVNPEYIEKRLEHPHLTLTLRVV